LASVRQPSTSLADPAGKTRNAQNSIAAVSCRRSPNTAGSPGSWRCRSSPIALTRSSTERVETPCTCGPAVPASRLDADHPVRKRGPYCALISHPNGGCERKTDVFDCVIGACFAATNDNVRNEHAQPRNLVFPTTRRENGPNWLSLSTNSALAIPRDIWTPCGASLLS
jgi:hypothetical protein